MTDPVEGHLRRMMGRLTELAPMAPSADELRGHRHRVARPARRTRLALAVAVVTIVGAAVALAPTGSRQTQVATGGAERDIDVRIEDLAVTYVPGGFTLEDDSTESVPDTLVPDPQSAARMLPQGNAGTRRTQRYNRGDEPGKRDVVYVSALLRPDRVQTVHDLEAQIPNAQPTTVGQRPAVLSVPKAGASGLIDVRWIESPHVVVMVTARGNVSLDEVRGMAEGVRFGTGPSLAAPSPQAAPTAPR